MLETLRGQAASVERETEFMCHVEEPLSEHGFRDRAYSSDDTWLLATLRHSKSDPKVLHK